MSNYLDISIALLMIIAFLYLVEIFQLAINTVSFEEKSIKKILIEYNSKVCLKYIAALQNAKYNKISFEYYLLCACFLTTLIYLFTQASSALWTSTTYDYRNIILSQIVVYTLYYLVSKNDLSFRPGTTFYKVLSAFLFQAIAIYIKYQVVPASKFLSIITSIALYYVAIGLLVRIYSPKNIFKKLKQDELIMNIWVLTQIYIFTTVFFGNFNILMSIKMQSLVITMITVCMVMFITRQNIKSTRPNDTSQSIRLEGIILLIAMWIRGVL